MQYRSQSIPCGPILSLSVLCVLMVAGVAVAGDIAAAMPILTLSSPAEGSGSRTVPVVDASLQGETPERVPPIDERSETEKKWGVEVIGVRLSAGGYILDFRYRIIAPERAVSLVDRRRKPYLIDRKTGARFTVPNPTKVGPLRQTAKYGKPKADRTYFILFANPGRFIKRNRPVDVVIGDFRASNLIVE